MKRHSSFEWIEYFDFKMNNHDGWADIGYRLDIPITLEEFVSRVKKSNVSQSFDNINWDFLVDN